MKIDYLRLLGYTVLGGIEGTLFLFPITLAINPSPKISFKELLFIMLWFGLLHVRDILKKKLKEKK